MRQMVSRAKVIYIGSMDTSKINNMVSKPLCSNVKHAMKYLGITTLADIGTVDSSSRILQHLPCGTFFGDTGHMQEGWLVSPT